MENYIEIRKHQIDNEDTTPSILHMPIIISNIVEFLNEIESYEDIIERALHFDSSVHRFDLLSEK